MTKADMRLCFRRECTEPLQFEFEATTKRWFDVVISAIALILLSPVFAPVAVLIKFDSLGPVFFRQRRRGYNTAEFQVLDDDHAR
jgi:polysaccharide biosynthesis protein PslA